MKADAREVLTQWAKWRKARISAGLYWPSRTALGRAMDGLPGTNCPTCVGRGRLKGSLIRAHAIYIICPTCGGSGRVKADITGHKVNPAFIRSTFMEPSDSQSERIDSLVCQLRRGDKTEKYYFVIWAEYVKGIGRQEDKAEKMNISHDYYRKLLERAHRLIEIGMDDVTISSINVVTKAGV
jgi:hypothetical protein